ncbi:MAG: thioredoxin family protein [Clostridia bacterium]|nr:thioredoxin family protein [Clostridia bacterium]
MTRVKVIGNSSDSRRMYEQIQKIVKEKGFNVDLRWEDISSSSAKSRYDVDKFPGLQIDGKMISQGKTNYSESELIRLIR